MSVCVEREKARMDYKQSLSHNGPCKKTGVSSSCLHNAAPYWQITNEHFILYIYDDYQFFTNDTFMQSHLYINTAIMMKKINRHKEIKMLSEK